jgi:hypothetical protein
VGDEASAGAFEAGRRIRGLPKVQTVLRWEEPVEQRVVALVHLAEDLAAENTSKSELVAALVMAAPEDGEAISRLIRTYRRSTMGDALVAGAEIVELGIRRPGPIPHTR